MATVPQDPEVLTRAVQAKYAGRALQVLNADVGCGPGPCDPISTDLYSLDEVRDVPEKALLASLGCGNPTALAELNAGEVVLDLGSGGGIDVLLSARRVGPSGFAYGLDMTDEMLALAEGNRLRAGLENVRFLKGRIEQVPLPDDHVDVVISNCVINLSADKPSVLREAFRVLKPGGRFAVADVVVQGQLTPNVRADLESWIGCVAGALEEHEYRALLSQAGFDQVELEVTRVHESDLASCGSAASSEADASEGRVVSAFVRARKPLPADRIRPMRLARDERMAELSGGMPEVRIPTGKGDIRGVS